MELFCKSIVCGWGGQPNISMSVDPIKATCPKCHKYIKFVKFSVLDIDDLINLKKWQEEQTGVVSEYKRGFQDGIKCFAHWKDGVEYVGTCGMTLEDALKSIENLNDYKED